jgi:hypothetical protein
VSVLVYNGKSISVGNDVLAYMQAVTAHVFSEGRSFTMGLAGKTNAGEAIRHYLWVHPSIPIEFTYDGNETIQLHSGLFEAYYEMILKAGFVVFGDLDAKLPYSFEETKSREDGTSGEPAE